MKSTWPPRCDTPSAAALDRHRRGSARDIVSVCSSAHAPTSWSASRCRDRPYFRGCVLGLIDLRAQGLDRGLDQRMSEFTFAVSRVPLRPSCWRRQRPGHGDLDNRLSAISDSKPSSAYPWIGQCDLGAGVVDGRAAKTAKGGFRITSRCAAECVADLSMQGTIQFALADPGRSGACPFGARTQPAAAVWGRMLNDAQTLRSSRRCSRSIRALRSRSPCLVSICSATGCAT